MRGRENRRAPSADLLVCFPSRAHLTLMAPNKSISSPAGPSESNKHHHSHNHNHNHNQQHHHHHLKKSSTRVGTAAGAQASPLLWAKNKQMGSEMAEAEPTSPKVTCAGQIKVRHKGKSCKNWQSVMEEIERIHSSRKVAKRRPTWTESLGFKKEIMQFLTCLRSLRLDFRCFGSFPQPDIISDDDDDDEDDHDEEEYKGFQDENHDGTADHQGPNGSDQASRTVFSKWFMMLQENQTNGTFYTEERKEKDSYCTKDDQSIAAAPSIPPPNALLLMRCRSAPAKSWLEEKQEAEDKYDHEEEQEEEEEEEEEEEDDDDDDDDDVDNEEKDRTRDEKRGTNLKTLMEEEKINSMKENLVVLTYDTDLYKISTDIAKETWVTGGARDPLSRSRSWKR